MNLQKNKSTCEIWSECTCKLQINHLQKAVILSRSLHIFARFSNTVISLMGLVRVTEQNAVL